MTGGSAKRDGKRLKGRWGYPWLDLSAALAAAAALLSLAYCGG